MEWREVRRRQNSPTREEHWPSSRWGCAQGRTRVSWKAIQGFEVRPRKASIWSQVRKLHRRLYSGQVPKRQLVRVDWDVKRKPAGCSFRKSQGTGATFLGVKRGWC